MKPEGDEMKRRAAVLISGVFAATGANAQGDFSFGDIPGVDVEPSIEIDLNPSMLGFLTEAAKGAGEQASGLEGITNVRVYVYEGIGDDLSDVLKFVDDTSQRLERDGWHSAVRVREDGEQVVIYMKPASSGARGAAGTIDGLTLMVTDSGGADEAVFINIAGQIQPAQLGRIAATIGMNGMFNLVPGVAPQDPPADSR
jgi:hypothetical protein